MVVPSPQATMRKTATASKLIPFSCLRLTFNNLCNEFRLICIDLRIKELVFRKVDYEALNGDPFFYDSHTTDSSSNDISKLSLNENILND